jgi:hypothetical protein
MTERTQASIAVEKLNSLRTVAEPPRWDYHSTREYIMVCHGCGQFHLVRSIFLSTPLSLAFNFADGSRLDVGCSGCPACMAELDPGNPIRMAWEWGIRRSTHNRAADFLGAKHWPEPQPCTLCGGTSGRLNTDGVHNLCAARAKLGQPTPCLGMDDDGRAEKRMSR